MSKLRTEPMWAIIVKSKRSEWIIGGAHRKMADAIAWACWNYQSAYTKTHNVTYNIHEIARNNVLRNKIWNAIKKKHNFRARKVEVSWSISNE